MLERILSHFGYKKVSTFLFHEVYPEIVFWKVGQLVTIKYCFKDSNRVFDSCEAVIDDFDKDGTIIVRAYSAPYNRPHLSNATYTLHFAKKLAPSSIKVTGRIKPNNRAVEFDAIELFNPEIRGKGKYMGLLDGIREAIGDVDWDNL